MDANTMTEIFQVQVFLQAIALQNLLDKAGMSVSILRSKNGYGLAVPAAQVAEANELLHPQTRTGEIYFIPSQPVRLSWTKD